MAKGWLDNYGKQENYNNSKTSVPEGYEGEGYSMKGRNYSPAWGGQFQGGGKVNSSTPVIDDAGNYNEEGDWIPDWKTMTAQAKKLGAKRVKTKHGSLIVFDDNWEVVGVDDNPDAMQMGGSVYPVNYVPEAAMGASIPGAVGFSYARTQGAAPSNGPYAKKTMASAQDGISTKYNPKTFKLKDERNQSIRPIESTSLKKPNFDLEQSKLNKTYVSQLADEQKEKQRRKKLTQDQREREDYNARNEERGSIQAHVPESTWDRSKAIASNPLTAFGYAARNQSLPARFQHGERNVLDNAIDWINPLQGIASASEIPGELGRGEYLNAGLSLLDAADLGVYAKGAKKQLRNLSPALGYKDGGVIKDDRGQWDHPGEITEIGSNDITMQGVPYDVLGISDTGDVKMMKPGKNYKFKGKKVTEFPMAQNGLRQEQKSLQNLDNLLNFTNYNKPQPGGWLNKYN